MKQTIRFLLLVSALAPIRDVICSTGSHTSFVHSVYPFLSDLDVSFASEIRLPLSKTGSRSDVVCLPFSHLISSLINQRLVALSLYLTINTCVDNSDFQSDHTWSLVSFCITPSLESASCLISSVY